MNLMSSLLIFLLLAVHMGAERPSQEAILLVSVSAQTSPTDTPTVRTSPTPPACPVTTANGDIPLRERSPGRTPVPAFAYHGNGQIWTVLPAKNGIWRASPRPENGHLVHKGMWWRTTELLYFPLIVEGRRLDALAPPMETYTCSGYVGDVQPCGISLPTEGCWEITGRAGDVSLTFVVYAIKVEAPPTATATHVGPTAIPTEAPAAAMVTPTSETATPVSYTHLTLPTICSV